MDTEGRSEKTNLVKWVGGLLVLLLVGGASYFIYTSVKIEPTNNGGTKSSSDNASLEDNLSDNSVEVYATLEGSLSYPSDYIPEMKICAVDTTTQEETCTKEMIVDDKYIYGTGYKLEVPLGKYKVYAQRIDENTDYKAYYNECDGSGECETHEPIIVNVLEEKTYKDINPIDWYDSSQR